MLSIPVVGSWVTDVAVRRRVPRRRDHRPRSTSLHVLLIPGVLLGADHRRTWACWSSRSTPSGPARAGPTHNVVGERMFPGFAVKAGGFFMIVFGVIALLGGLFQINPIWLFGPYEAAVVSAAQPARLVRHVPRRLDPAHAGLGDHIPIGDGYTHPAAVLADGGAARHPDHAADVLPVHRGPAHEGQRARTTCCSARATCRRAPALGAMAIAFYIVLTLSGGNDVIADKFHISLNAMTWAGRIGLLVVPPLAYYVDLPDLPGPAAARPRGAGARRGDRHHPAAARRRVRRGAPAAGRGRRARPRRAGLRRLGRAEEDEPARRARPGDQGLLLPDRAARPRRRSRPGTRRSSPREEREEITSR